MTTYWIVRGPNPVIGVLRRRGKDTEMEKRKSRDTQEERHMNEADRSNAFTSQNHRALPAATSSRGHGIDSPLEPPVGTNQP